MQFNELKLHPWILKTLNCQNIKKMTDIQAKTIPLSLRNKNIIGVSFTGSGKTLSFLIPILNTINLDHNLQSIIIAPTRELARQIYSVLNIFKKNEPKLKIQMLIGGVDYQKQIKSIKSSKPQIIVCTVQKLKESVLKKDIDFSNLRFLTLDEADMLMDLGFFNDLDTIIEVFDHPNLIKSAWSATLHEMLSVRLAKYFKDTKIVNIGKTIYENQQIKHYAIFNHDKIHSLAILLKKINPYLCIIFANKKTEVETIYQFLKKNHYSVTMIHGSLDTRTRKNNYKEIKQLKYQYVVASDLASRGLDIDGVSHVISWNLAQDNEWYIHRSGRSGRGKYQGESWVLLSDKNDDEKLLYFEKKNINFSFFQIKNNNLIAMNYSRQNKKIVHDDQTQKNILKIVNKKSKIKPGYKKKKRLAIQKVKNKSKRKYLDQKIKENLVQTYKKKNSSRSNL